MEMSEENMEHFIKNELKKLSVACDIFSMEMEFAAIFSELTNAKGNLFVFFQ